MSVAFGSALTSANLNGSLLSRTDDQATITAQAGFVENSSLALSNGGTISISLVNRNQQWLIKSASGAITLASAPFGASAPATGTELELVGSSDTDTVTVEYNDVSKGTLMNGPWTSARGASIKFRYNTTLDRYVEVSRS